jgi:SAM-dependent methyltransferase
MFSVVECEGCGLLRLDPWPTPRELARYYPPNYWFAVDNSTSGKLAEFYRRVVLLDHVRFAEEALRATRGPLLDVGCGGALFGRMLAEKGFLSYGLDYSRDAASVAYNFNGVPVTCGELTHAPFARETFGVVSMFHVLEHLRDPAAYVTAAHDLLEPGGRLIVQVPNAASWQFLMFGENWNGIDIPRHLVDFRAADLEKLLQYCGFKVLRTKHFSLRDNPAGFASSLFPGLDPMARRVRKTQETPAGRMIRDLAYFGLVLVAIPFTAVESACGAGATVIIDAEKV